MKTIVCLTVGQLLCWHCHATDYQILDLGTLGGSSSEAAALNDDGQVAGWADTTGGEQHAFLWTPGEGMADLGTLGGSYSFTLALNKAGQVVGYSDTASGRYHAFLWTPGLGMADLGTLGGLYSYGVALNEVGQAAGWADTASGERHAFLWTPGLGMADLGTLGGSYSRAEALNDAGQVAGLAYVASGLEHHAFLWSPGLGMADLDPLGIGSYSFARALNGTGRVAGGIFTTAHGWRAFRWSPSGGIVCLDYQGNDASVGVALNEVGQVAGMVDYRGAFLWTPGVDVIYLGTQGGLYSHDAVALNEVGQVAGWANTASGEQHAFLWTPGLGMADLRTLGGSYSYAVALNERGQVAGWAHTGSGERHACIWSEFVGKVVPDAPCRTDERSRTLVNGTCWHFVAQPDDGQAVAKVRWTLEDPNGSLLSTDGSAWHNTVDTSTHSVWFGAGTSQASFNCKVKAELLDQNGNSLGALAPAVARVRFVPGFRQDEYAGTVGFREKEATTRSSVTIRPPKTIAAIGCNLTCYAMLSQYLELNGATPFTPPQLEVELRSLRYANGFQLYKGQYTNVSGDLWQKDTVKVPQPVYLDVNHNHVPGDDGDAWTNPAFEGEQLRNEGGWPAFVASGYVYHGVVTDIDRDLISELEQEPPRPSLVHVTYYTNKRHQHWVLAVGLTPPSATGDREVMILDPFFGGVPTAFSSNTRGYLPDKRVQLCDGYARKAWQIQLGCRAHVFVTDASGKVAGVVPSGEFLDQIGGAVYEMQDDDGVTTFYARDYFESDGGKTLTLQAPQASSTYQFTVFGTGAGPYFLGSSVVDPTGSPRYFDFEGGFVDLGVKWVYACSVDPATGVVAGRLVPPTASTMSSDIAGYLCSKDIDNSGIAKSLQQKLDAANKALDQGQTKATANVLNAFINEVYAQSGKHIAIPAANNLVFHARFVIDHLP